MELKALLEHRAVKEQIHKQAWMTGAAK